MKALYEHVLLALFILLLKRRVYLRFLSTFSRTEHLAVKGSHFETLMEGEGNPPNRFFIRTNILYIICIFHYSNLIFLRRNNKTLTGRSTRVRKIVMTYDWLVDQLIASRLRTLNCSFQTFIHLSATDSRKIKCAGLKRSIFDLLLCAVIEVPWQKIRVQMKHFEDNFSAFITAQSM